MTGARIAQWSLRIPLSIQIRSIKGILSIILTDLIYSWLISAVTFQSLVRKEKPTIREQDRAIANNLGCATPCGDLERIYIQGRAFEVLRDNQPCGSDI